MTTVFQAQGGLGTCTEGSATHSSISGWPRVQLPSHHLGPSPVLPKSTEQTREGIIPDDELLQALCTSFSGQ